MTDTHEHSVLRRAEQELVVARARTRDLEAFIRIYRELVTAPGLSAVADQPELLSSVSTSAVSRPPVSLADSDLSITDAAEKVLRAVGRPMKGREIAERLLDWGFPYPAGVQKLRSSVGGVLSRKVGMKDAFWRPKPGTFALLEWENERENDARGGAEGRLRGPVRSDTDSDRIPVPVSRSENDVLRDGELRPSAVASGRDLSLSVLQPLREMS